ncbi:MAG TPA: DUF5693 family protein [Actinopolymorphaceae bacterium]
MSERPGSAPVAIPPAPTARPVRRALLIAVIAVLLTIPAWTPRWDAERNHPGTELAVTDTALRLWDAQKATDTKNAAATVLPDLSAAGVTTVDVGMRQIGDAIARGQLKTVDAAAVSKANLDAKIPATGPGVWLESLPRDPSGTWQVLERMLHARAAASRSGAAGVKMPEKLTSTKVQTKSGWVGYLRFDTQVPVNDLPAGYDRDRIRALLAAKVSIVLALPPRSPAPVPWLIAELDDVEVMAKTTRVLVSSGATFDDAASTDTLAGWLGRPAHTLLVPDLVDDRSDFGPYVDAGSGRTIRPHLVPFASSADENSLLQRGRRATKERGVRMIVVQAPASPGSRLPVLPADVGLRSLAASVPILSAWHRNLPTSIGARSPAVVMGVASPMAAVQPGFVARGLGLLGGFVILAGATFALTEVRVRWHRGIYRALPRPLAAVIFCAAPLVGLFTWLHPVQALTSALMLAVAVAAATASVVTAVTGQPAPARLHDRLSFVRWAGFLGRFVTAIATAAAGGWVLGAMGASDHYLLLSDGFVGVKVLLLAPVLLVGVIGFGAARAELTYTGELFVVDLVRHRIILASLTTVVVGLGVLYLVRSGNSGTATGPELWFRDWLDSQLYVRPRFKELLLGGPALLLALRWPGVVGKWVCATIAAIGTASILDSFAHFHVPLAVSLLRTGYGAVGGLIVGLLLSVAIPAVVGPLREALRTLEPEDDDTGSGGL